VCLTGVVLSFCRKNRAATLKFALVGLASVLAIFLVAIIGYRHDLGYIAEGLSLASWMKAFEVQCAGIHLAASNLNLGLLAAAVPALLSLLMLVRGFMLPRDRDEAAGKPLPVALTVLCFGSGAWLLCASLFSYLDFDSFFLALMLWWV
jgi:hypothetical protein